MTQNIQRIKYKNKKYSKFRQQPARSHLKQLLNCITESCEINHSKLIEQILEKRKQKINELRMLRSRAINQNYIRISRSVEIFSDEKPISIGDKFVEYKQRENLLSPERAFNNQPNIKAGSPKMKSDDSGQDPKIISKKFQQFVRIFDEQSGVLKRKKFSQGSNQENSLPQIKSPYKLSMKKTYFKKYASDQYNFYRPPIKEITRVQKIFDLTLQRQSTTNSRVTQLQKCDILRPYHTVEIELASDRSYKKTSVGSKTLDAYRRN